jgi:hypothetical protein
MDEKKTSVIRNWISNYVQGGIIDGFIKKMNLPRPIYTALTVACNLDKLSIVQYTIAQLGIYKWAAYCVYFLFFA